MDLTDEFKRISGPIEEHSNLPTQPVESDVSFEQDDFIIKSHDIASQIEQLFILIRDHSEHYIGSFSLGVKIQGSMTSSERDVFMTKCQESINLLTKSVHYLQKELNEFVAAKKSEVHWVYLVNKEKKMEDREKYIDYVNVREHMLTYISSLLTEVDQFFRTLISTRRYIDKKRDRAMHFQPFFTNYIYSPSLSSLSSYTSPALPTGEVYSVAETNQDNLPSFLIGHMPSDSSKFSSRNVEDYADEVNVNNIFNIPSTIPLPASKPSSTDSNLEPDQQENLNPPSGYQGAPQHPPHLKRHSSSFLNQQIDRSPSSISSSSSLSNSTSASICFAQEQELALEEREMSRETVERHAKVKFALQSSEHVYEMSEGIHAMLQEQGDQIDLIQELTTESDTLVQDGIKLIRDAANKKSMRKYFAIVYIILAIILILREAFR